MSSETEMSSDKIYVATMKIIARMRKAWLTDVAGLRLGERKRFSGIVAS